MQIEAAMEAICLATRMILENGGETYRAEETALHMGRGFGADKTEVFAMPTGLMMTLSVGEESRTRILRIHSGETNLTKLNECNTISRQVSAGKLNVHEALKKLRDLSKDPGNPAWVSILTCALSSGFFCVMFSGGWIELATAFVIGAVCRLLINHFSSRQVPGMLTGMMLGFLITLLSLLVQLVIPALHAESVISGALMPFLPGLAMTAAIRDTIRGDLVSGGARVTGAFLTAVMLAAGAAVMLALWPAQYITVSTAVLPLSLRLFGCFIAELAFGKLMNIPLRGIIFGAAVGTISYFIFILMGQTSAAYFAAAIFMCMTGEAAARMMKCTATILITPCIIPLVPGLGLYRTMLYLVQKDYHACAATGLSTALGILCIALALTISAVLFANLRRFGRKEKK